MQTNNRGIPMAVIRRMTRYYRYLLELEKSNISKISSQSFADKLGLTSSQVRQDFGYFGGFGHKGYGYEVTFLKNELKKILGLESQKKCILIGVGNLGTAILSMNYERVGFSLIGVFDNNPQLLGKTIRGSKVFSMDSIEDFCKNESPECAIICTPSAGVHELATKLYDCGIRSFWNFSHYDISILFPDAIVENVHLNDSMMTLRFLMEG